MEQNSEMSVKTGKARNYKQYGKTVWDKIRTEYENKDISALKLAEGWKVSEKSVFWHIKREKWIKGKNLAVIHASIAEKNKAALIKLGVTDEMALEVLRGGLIEPTVVVWEGKGEALHATTEPDYKTRLDYLREYNKLTAAYPEKQEKDGDKHVHFHLDPEKLKEKSADQVISEYQRLISGE